MTQPPHGGPEQTPIETAELERLDRILRDPLSGLTWDNRIMAANAIREVLDRREAEGWRDISTAPLTGERVLVWRPTMWGGKGHIGVAYWASDQYAKNSRPFWSSVEGYIGKTENRAHPPTHWRPLPAPPTTPTTEASHGE